MILHRRSKGYSSLDYGIDIPAGNNKVKKVLDALRSHPVIAKHWDTLYREASDTLISKKDLLRVHSQEYVEDLFSERLEQWILRTFELIDEKGHTPRYRPEKATRPLSEIFERTLKNVSGTYECCKLALSEGFCFFMGGGAHHAQKDFGKGFCLLNDIVIAVRKVQADDNAGVVWIIDLDVHKGDGTAALTEGDDSVVTLSAHMAKGWPLDEEKYDAEGRLNPSFVPSDIDVPVDVGEERHYVPRLKKAIVKLSGFPTPDLAVVVSGVDAYEKDELPSTAKLKLSKKQLRSRDRFVYRFLEKRGIPMAYLTAGGYGKSSWEIYNDFIPWIILRRLSAVDRKIHR